jgi:5-formyltetrahydrofolate cyclo-ligase
MEINKEKKILRKHIKSLKESYSSTELGAMSRQVMQQVEQLELFKVAKCVMVYWSLSDEVDTHAFVERWHRDKQIILPKVEGELLELRLFEGEKLLKVGRHFGIMEPAGALITDYSSIDFVVVPGVAFTAQGERLGRGGGYYDRLLPQLKGAFKAGVAFPFQVLEYLPVDGFDMKMDVVVWDKTQKPA